MNISDFHRVARMIDQIQPNLGSYANIAKMIDQLQPNLGGALADIAKIREMQPNLGGALADISNEALDELIAAPAEHNADIESPVLEADTTDAIAPPSPSTDLQDVPEGLLEVVTAELLMRLGTWCDLYGVLVDIEGLESARLEVARQIDECLRRLARSVESDGVCWGCDEATLIPYGVACEDCAVIVAQMMLEALFLAEGPS